MVAATRPPGRDIWLTFAISPMAAAGTVTPARGRDEVATRDRGGADCVHFILATDSRFTPAFT
jgi:hypothetical protein